MNTWHYIFEKDINDTHKAYFQTAFEKVFSEICKNSMKCVLNSRDIEKKKYFV